MPLIPRYNDIPFNLNNTYPAGVSGSDPNYVVENNGPLLTVSAITLMAITVVIVSARVYSRVFLLGFMGADDYCILGATVAAIGLVVSSCLSVISGVGKHVWDVPPLNFVEMAKIGYISQIFYIASLGFTKASLSLLLIRLSPSVKMLRITWVIFGFTTAYSISALFSSIFPCIPLSYGWTRLDPNSDSKGSCVDYLALQYAILSFNIFTDITIWLLPLKLISQVNLPPRQKWGLYAVFALGGLAPVSAVVRMIVILHTTILDPTLADPTCLGSAVEITVWSIVEVTVAIMCSSIPVLRPLLKKVVPTLMGTLNSFRSASRSRHSGYQSWAIGKRATTTVKDSVPLDSVEHVNGSAPPEVSGPTGIVVVTNIDTGGASYYDNHSVDFPVPGSSYGTKAKDGNKIMEVTVQGGSKLKEEV